MKFFTTLLSIYFLALSFAPCEDAGANNNDIPSENSQAVSADHDHSAVDLCTPFCQCHCCHVNTIDVSIVAFELVQTPFLRESFVHFDSIGKDIFHSLLQPPRA